MVSETTVGLNETLDQLMDALVVQSQTTLKSERVHLPTILKKITTVLKADIVDSKAIIQPDWGFHDITTAVVYLESMIQNLVSNAIRYRSPDRVPEVTIRTRVWEGRAILEVQDNGLGIDLKKHGRKLFGLHKTFHCNPQAKGFGLFMVKNQIEALGGSAEVESEEGVGSVFRILFSNDTQVKLQ
jgi:signal transduction histidine kinase